MAGYIDGKQSSINYTNKHGLIQFFVSPGKHTVIAKFGETTFRLICDIISLMSIFIIIFLSFLPKRGAAIR